VDLLASLFPHISSELQTYAVQQLHLSLNNVQFERAQDRKLAVVVNVVVLLQESIRKFAQLNVTKGAAKKAIAPATAEAAQQLLQARVLDTWLMCVGGHQSS
jgi:hypothetical protein